MTAIIVRCILRHLTYLLLSTEPFKVPLRLSILLVILFIGGACPLNDEVAICQILKALPGLQTLGWGTCPTTIANVCSWSPNTLGCVSNSVTFITFIGMRISGTLPPQIGNLTNLSWLSIYDNQISGTLPTQIGNLSKLTLLYLSDNAISGQIPTQLGKLTKLLYVTLENNLFQGTLPTQIGNLKSMTQFYIYNNSISGTIPTTIGGLTSIHWLDFHNTQISGTIPTQIGHCNSLTILYLQNTEISGTIPTQIGLFNSLTMLYIYYTELSGTIPTQIGNLLYLQYLNLHHTYLSGTLPTQIGILSNLNYLELSNTSLSGSLPTQLTSLHNLATLDLSNTNMYCCDMVWPNISIQYCYLNGISRTCNCQLPSSCLFDSCNDWSVCSVLLPPLNSNSTIANSTIANTPNPIPYLEPALHPVQNSIMEIITGFYNKEAYVSDQISIIGDVHISNSTIIVKKLVIVPNTTLTLNSVIVAVNGDFQLLNNTKISLDILSTPLHINGSCTFGGELELNVSVSDAGKSLTIVLASGGVNGTLRKFNLVVKDEPPCTYAKNMMDYYKNGVDTIFYIDEQENCKDGLPLWVVIVIACVISLAVISIIILFIWRDNQKKQHKLDLENLKMNATRSLHLSKIVAF